MASILLPFLIGGKDLDNQRPLDVIFASPPLVLQLLPVKMQPPPNLIWLKNILGWVRYQKLVLTLKSTYKQEPFASNILKKVGRIAIFLILCLSYDIWLYSSRIYSYHICVKQWKKVHQNYTSNGERLSLRNCSLGLLSCNKRRKGLTNSHK